VNKGPDKRLKACSTCVVLVATDGIAVEGIYDGWYLSFDMLFPLALISVSNDQVLIHSIDHVIVMFTRPNLIFRSSTAGLRLFESDLAVDNMLSH
jgi:hypothetical protein